MALKKSDLYSTLWSGCDELGGGLFNKRIVGPQGYAP